MESVPQGSFLAGGEDTDGLDIIVGQSLDDVELATARSCGDCTAEMRRTGVMSGPVKTTVKSLATGSDHDIISVQLLQKLMPDNSALTC